jgi:hypothetical protein
MVNRIAGMECSIKIEHKLYRLRIQRFEGVDAEYCASDDDPGPRGYGTCQTSIMANHRHEPQSPVYVPFPDSERGLE